MRFRATLYPSVESDDYECEANSVQEAQEIIQGYSDNNYGFLCLLEDIEEIEEDDDVNQKQEVVRK